MTPRTRVLAGIFLAVATATLILCGSVGAQAAPRPEPGARVEPVAGLSLGSAEVTAAAVVGNIGFRWLFPPAVLQGLAFTVVPVDQIWAFNQIISHESSWNVFALNPSSGAYGLAQALPGEKMAAEALDWPINPVTQIRWAYHYMNERYGSPNAAWEFWQAHHWY